MIYKFKTIENGQIAEGYCTIQISNFQAEIANDDAPAILLAEKHGGELVEPKKVKSEPKGESN
jgi:hypothetical protein